MDLVATTVDHTLAPIDAGKGATTSLIPVGTAAIMTTSAATAKTGVAERALAGVTGVKSPKISLFFFCFYYKGAWKQTIISSILKMPTCFHNLL